jgi:hypothetical protein
MLAVRFEGSYGSNVRSCKTVLRVVAGKSLLFFEGGRVVMRETETVFLGQ